jgi:26S proteasome regulatory subunit N5
MSGAPRKQEKDYSEEVKALQPQAEELAKVSYHCLYIEADSQSGNLQGAIDKITGLEKQTRNVSSPEPIVSLYS